MFFLSHLRERKIKPLLNAKKKFYNGKNSQKIAEYQLEMFNKQWKKTYKNVPYYKQLVKDKKVSNKITTWDEFNRLPIASRSDIRNDIEKYSNRKKKADQWVNTGGSTGTPLNYPKWNSEKKHTEVNTWYANGFYNIKRSDKLFRLWGHSHTLGKGLSKYKNILKLKIGHLLIGYKRFSAYDLSKEKLREAGDAIIKFEPDYIIGYSKALNLLAKYNQDKTEKFHKLNIKAVIGAAEGFDKESDKILINSVFDSPVGLQYSSMETGLIAHTHPNGNYKVLWGDYLIECIDDNGNPSSEGRILVTSLYPRAFPLIRYELGDIIIETHKDEQSVFEFKRVQGRDNDFLKLDDETTIHSEAISHAVKYSDRITAYQIRYTEESEYTLYLISNHTIGEKDINEIKNRLSRIDKRLFAIEVKQVEKLKQTIAGKTKWLIEE